tara:strand:- start:119 stop:802 length:684 start_codon:yes stop_codon:yes gene_type:complete
MSTAEEYNDKKMSDGSFSPEMIAQLVEFWQSHHSLVVDGKCGPNTQGSLRDAKSVNPSEASTRAGIIALEIAISQIGNGEEGGNNSGPFVEMLKHKEYDGDTDDDGAWCASFVSWCFEQAYEAIGEPMPFAYSEGAKQTWKNIGNAGSFPESPAPGDVVCWDRGDPGSWQGHIGFVEKLEDGILYTVEGNVGSYPSKVRRFQHVMKDQDRLEGFGRTPGPIYVRVDS